MCRLDMEYGQIFGVVETLVAEGDKIPPPEIIKKPIEFVDKLINGGNFQSLTIETEAQYFSFFPSRKLAEDYLDELVKPIVFRG